MSFTVGGENAHLICVYFGVLFPSCNKKRPDLTVLLFDAVTSKGEAFIIFWDVHKVRLICHKSLYRTCFRLVIGRQNFASAMETYKGRSQGWVGGLSPAAPFPPGSRSLLNTDFVDAMISNILSDFPFILNRPLLSAYD